MNFDNRKMSIDKLIDKDKAVIENNSDPNKKVLYQSICSYCGTNYNNRIYKGEDLIYEHIKPPCDAKITEILKSHGSCEICRDKVYEFYNFKTEGDKK